jgi:hypothetical protein
MVIVVLAIIGGLVALFVLLDLTDFFLVRAGIDRFPAGGGDRAALAWRSPLGREVRLLAV